LGASEGRPAPPFQGEQFGGEFGVGVCDFEHIEGTNASGQERLVGISQAAEWVYTGRLFSAEEALSGGLVRSIHEPEDLLPAAYAIAREIAENTSPVSVALSRQMMWRMLGADHPMEAHRVDSRGIQMRGRSADAKEGVVSFLEKRAAVFTDKVSDGLPAIFPDWEDPEFS
jgi:enoyl-CoA hydratase/carnithine racemase